MNITPIEWCDQTWNPVTGCMHGCPYCYAIKRVRRFKRGYEEIFSSRNINTLDAPGYVTTKKGKTIKNAYPFGFEPTFHRYRLEEPQYIKKPQNIFVCSMADLFGEFIPDEWIQAVFEACEAAPQHRYLFLTKNPKRYMTLKLPLNENIMFGATITNKESPTPYYSQGGMFQSQRFISFEPLLDDIAEQYLLPIVNSAWVIIGAESGNRKDKVIPKKEWIQNILDKCQEHNVPVFMKDSIVEIWGEPLIQEYPWENGVKNGK